MYRNHEAPDAAKIAALDETLKSFGLKFSRGQGVTPKALNTLLEKVAGSDAAPLVNDLVLRAQSLAVYGPNNLGHFGLSLGHYAHFTSPIRRYADLLVHRSLITAYRLGDGGWDTGVMPDFEEVGGAISGTEQRAATAERDTMDRYVASFMATHVGQPFEGRVRGVTRAGLFVALPETGAEGLLPMRLLPDDRYDIDEKNHRLVGRRWGKTYQLGQALAVRLLEADAASGSLLFEPLATAKDSRPARHPGGRPGSDKNLAKSRNKKKKRR